MRTLISRLPRAACFIALLATVITASASTVPSFSALEELVVTPNETKRLPAGGYRFKSVVLKDNSTLEIVGSTTVLTGKLEATTGARIVYVPGSSADADKVLAINAIDASGLKSLRIETNGANAVDYAPNARAADGGDGQDAASRWVSRGFKSYYRNKSSSPGGAGASGAAGRPGEDGFDVQLSLPKLKPGAQITIESIGGKGGRGQDGGHGGQGGDSSTHHTASRGGPGGAAGAGGKGGDAGKIAMFVVLSPAEMANANAVIKATNVKFNTRPGAGGSPGEPGGGGGAGDTHRQFCIGAGCSAKDGSPGATSNPGAQGDGAMPGDVNQSWASIDAMDLSTYQQYVAQVWNGLAQ